MVNALFVLVLLLNQAVPVLISSSASKEAEAMYQDGRTLIRANQFAEAATLAEKCLSLDPKKADCHVLAGGAYARLSQQEKAARHYRKFLELAPNHEAAPRVRKILEDFDGQKAASAPEKTDEASVVHKEGLTLFRAKQYNQAALKVEKCLALDPARAVCHLLGGAIHARLGNMEKGAHHYREFVRLAPDSPEVPKIREVLENYEKANKK